MLDLHEKIETAVAVIRQHWDQKPQVGVILGTGLGDLVEQIDVDVAIAAP